MWGIDMTLKQLSHQLAKGNHPGIEVHAIDPSIYLLFISDAMSLRPVVDEKGQTLRYRSRASALSELRTAGAHHADFVHRTAYNEMVGTASQGPSELRQRIHLTGEDRA